MTIQEFTADCIRFARLRPGQEGEVFDLGMSNIVDSTVCNCIINDCVIKNCTVKASVLRNAIINGKECCVSLKLGQMACVPKVYKSYAVTIDNDRINMLFISDKNVWEFDVCSPEELLIALKFHRV